jgi:translin
MRSEIEKARRYFELMEGLYSMLAPFAVYDHVANGVRRKIDVDRMLTEDVRGVMAEEARRTMMVSSIRDLQATLEGKGTKRARGNAKVSRKAVP